MSKFFYIEQTSSDKNLSFERVEIVEEVVEEMNSTEISDNWKKLIKKDRDRSDWRQAYVNYAYQVGGMELVTLIECENAQRDPHRKAYWNEDSWGLCMMHRAWHREVVDNPLFRDDWKRQITQCNTKMKWWTKFYWPERMIEGMNCSTYVKDRFYFE